jgi:curli biogenesis system outer membrane secretion channel CsgG
MILRRTVVLATTAAAIAAPLMTSATASTSGLRATSSGKVYTYANNGQTVSFAKVTTFKVRLQNCADCGEQWHFVVKPSSRQLNLVSRREVSTAKPPAVGGEAHTIWTFQTTRNPGRTTMVMAETSAEKGGKTIKRFTLHVRVSRLVT